ncbi:hypothetical protein ABIB40_001702 [Pedobacter sp. UYP30]|uniref:hypothetical protein n=1 Tax=Pedobacter sp. UYP30 TaxID=1756400 RepID=UPI003399E836
MKLIKVIPKICYADVSIRLNLFVNGLGFRVAYSEPDTKFPFYIIERDEVKDRNMHLVTS